MCDIGFVIIAGFILIGTILAIIIYRNKQELKIKNSKWYYEVDKYLDYLLKKYGSEENNAIFSKKDET